MPLIDLITLEEAKGHLQETSNQRNADIQAKLDAAVAIIIDYLTRRDTTWNATMAAWTADTIPLGIKQAMLVQLGELMRERGDDAQQITPNADREDLSPAVKRCLKRYRDPTLA
jgi:hypothetical protein